MQLFSPAIKPFARLKAADGLLITADHWQRTQNYHRSRQNFYYQALHQAGIVSGLGVTVTPAPEAVEARYRNDRWIQVQPGIAIDAQGNPIIVTEPYAFQVQSVFTEGDPKTVYIVLNYVDPDELRHPSGRDWVEETFRIVEKTTLDILDVELCRIHLKLKEMALTIAADVFFPEANSLDLTHRQSLSHRPEGIVSIAHIVDPAAPIPNHRQGLTHLLKAVNVLYPPLAGETTLLEVPLDIHSNEDLTNPDLLYLPYDKLPALSGGLRSVLHDYVEDGGVLLIVDEDNSRRSELAKIRQELLEALADAENDPSLAAEKNSLKAEIAAYDAELSQIVQTVQQSVVTFANQLNIPLAGSGEIAAEHPLRTTPFLFSRWPETETEPIELFGWGGIVLMLGNLPQAWGPDAAQRRSRETIRTAHELGINLLYYAWRRRQLMELQRSNDQALTLLPQDSLTHQVTH